MIMETFVEVVGDTGVKGIVTAAEDVDEVGHAWAIGPHGPEGAELLQLRKNFFFNGVNRLSAVDTYIFDSIV